MPTRRLFVILLGTILALATFGRTHTQLRAQTLDAAAVDAAFKQAFLAGDLDGVFALYAADAVETAPFGAFTGKEAIRAATEGFITQNPHLTVSFSASTVLLDTAIHRIALSSDPIRAAGVSRIWVIHTLVVAQGKIVSLSAIPDISDAETLRFVQR